ncbi:hypothetical protein [Thalassotalea fusca]
MNYLVLVSLLILLLASLPAYIIYTNENSTNSTLFWRLYFSDSLPRVFLTTIGFPVIGLISVFNIAKRAKRNQDITYANWISAGLTLSWTLLLIFILMN